jgi:hypothetical protein
MKMSKKLTDIYGRLNTRTPTTVHELNITRPYEEEKATHWKQTTMPTKYCMESKDNA